MAAKPPVPPDVEGAKNAEDSVFINGRFLGRADMQPVLDWYAKRLEKAELLLLTTAMRALPNRSKNEIREEIERRLE